MSLKLWGRKVLTVLVFVLREQHWCFPIFYVTIYSCVYRPLERFTY